MSFFTDNAAKLGALELTGRTYRECQIGAAWATLAHFTASSEPALISMPTGSGKTALMMMLSFLLKAERVIVISPSVALRDQTASKFETLSDLKEAGAYPVRGPGPRVLDHQGQLTSEASWRVFLNYDVIVATPHTTSPGFEQIVGPSHGLFGPETLLVVDEAHHSRARTWQVLMEAFSANRMILLTATPFRNDNRRLLAKLVYHYPMRKALEAGIYAPITYHPVDPPDAKDKDQELCRTAVRIYRKQVKKHPKARLLIRAEGVTKSEELLKLYRAAGLTVEEVNYKQTLQDNKGALDALRSGRLDAVVCVDQIGEGLDVPHLKVAVLHKPRQSFPATVQFVGRISREASADTGEPQLIACPDDVKGPLQRLYTRDNSWREFVPKLVERIVGRATRRSAFHGVVDVETELDLRVEDIRPFLSVRAYKSSRALTFEKPLELRDDIVPAFLHEIPDKDMLVLVTAVEKTFPWAEDADLSAPHFDLHVYYWHSGTKFLFECTTADKIATKIREALWDKAAQRVDAATVAKALRQATASQYLMFGLSNLARGSRSVPSYKTYMGTEVEGAIRPSDSRSFTPGHALAKYATGETRGIGSNQARVWSIKRASLEEFKEWCDRVAGCLKKGGDGRLPNVEFLAAPEVIAKFPARPLAMYARWNPELVVSFDTSGRSVEIGNISFEQLALTTDKRAIDGVLRLGDVPQAEETGFTYSLGTPRWHFERADMPSLRVDDGQEVHWTSLAELLDAYPPIVVLEDGSTVIGGSRFEPRLQLSSLPGECLDCDRNWKSCDIHVEFEYRDTVDPTKNRIPKPGKLSVHDQLEQWLKVSGKRETLVIKDHASGEIADFVEISRSDSTIRFYHCKACSPGKAPGARLEELKMLEQVLRSVNRIGGNTLLSDLHERVIGTSRPETRMVKGGADGLKRLVTTFHSNEWLFEVVVVNPGLDCKRAVRARNTNTLLIACYEWLATANATLRVVGS